MKLLYVTSISPFPANNGGRQRTKLIWEALARLGDVDTVLHSSWTIDQSTLQTLKNDFRMVQYHLTPDPTGTFFGRMLRWGILPRQSYQWAKDYASRKKYYSPSEPAATQIRSLCRNGNYDAVVVRYLRCACRSGLLGYSPLFIDIDDVDSDFFSSTAEAREVPLFKRIFFRRQARRLHNLMEKWLRRVDTAWISKDEDAKKIGPRARLLPNAVDSRHPPAAVPAEAAGHSMVFVGALHWAPNQIGLSGFVRDSLPAICAQVPGAKLRVVGSGAPPEFIEDLRASAGVEFIGEVDDVAPYYRQAQLAIVPVNSGAGSHIKVPECLYHGITCVTSLYGHRGYGNTLPDGQALLVGPNAATFTQACVNLLRDAPLRHRLASYGLDVVKALYTREAFFQNVAHALSGVKARTRSAPIASET